MSVFAVVPVKELRGAKSRLGAVLDSVGRAGLTLHMLRRVVPALRGAGMRRVLVVSPDSAVLEEARLLGAEELRQGGSGLNAALEEGRRWALAEGAEALLVLPADLPLIEPADVEALLEVAGEEPCAVISPDAARSGTNALLLRPPGALPFSFGPDSFGLHLQAALRKGVRVRVCERPNLAFDLDSPEDLARLEASGGVQYRPRRA
ncbi:Phosphoenolpyruvate guanylyltransferase [Rubrobacter xylanophilus DSM 9941]|uniref:2-phospho-L-lactate guanylyltransferase n=1 Tax=Rubrobacter xylanophilus TaxID=49319 RepID=UPI001C63D2F7|nr:2-phospho-L-lactate guanylyltransferase [Rubrobacter xylanophilus]QYJ17178.1 Phosphoenolpyruvate guanylyltransferase [Rubrobacter xylanophilus DSM 9941]